MSVLDTTHGPAVDIQEPFRNYEGDWGTPVRTDTPDLIVVFELAIEDAIMREWTPELDEDAAAVHADLAEASHRALDGQ